LKLNAHTDSGNTSLKLAFAAAISHIAMQHKSTFLDGLVAG
jgi:hypothetical protein